jgi:organic hydroperoxide reductase OsmC/OhrA
MSNYSATIEWTRKDAVFTDNKYSRAHHWHFDGGVSVLASSSPKVVPLPLSIEKAVDPEEAFIASVASCHMLWFLSIAAKKKFCIESYTDRATGVMQKNANGKLAITEITLNPFVQFIGEIVPNAETILDMHHKAHDECFIANSILTEIKINPKI